MGAYGGVSTQLGSLISLAQANGVLYLDTAGKIQANGTSFYLDASGSNFRLRLNNTNTANDSAILLQSATGVVLSLYMLGTAEAGSVLGITAAGFAIIEASSACNGLMIAVDGNKPIIHGINGVETVRFNGAGLPLIDVSDTGDGVRLKRGSTDFRFFTALGGPGYFGTESAHDLNIRTNGTLRITLASDGKLGFFGGAAVAKPAVTGVKIDAVAGSIVAALAALGLVTDSTT